MPPSLNALARTITAPTAFGRPTYSSARLSLLLRRPAATTVVRTLPLTTATRRMASSASAPAAEPRKYEWLVVVPDVPGSLAKRLEVRPQHFAGLSKMKESGLFKMGGAVLEDMPADDEVSSMKFAGSTVIVVAESRQAVIDLLKDDVYVSSGVWDLEKAMIWPAKIAFRLP